MPENTFENHGIVIKGIGINEVYCKAIRFLLEQEYHCAYYLCLKVINPTVVQEDDEFYQKLNSLLVERNLQNISTVAETIFPRSLYNPQKPDSAERLYRRYKKIFPYIKQCKKNSWGLYFQRLINWHDEINQLDTIISKLKNGKPMRACYIMNIVDPAFDMILYDAEKDKNRRMSGPCLSYIDIKREEDKIHLFATYRNHFYKERLYGNMIGLTGLLDFICDQTGYHKGLLFIVSTMAGIDNNQIDALKTLCVEEGDTNGD